MLPLSRKVGYVLAIFLIFAIPAQAERLVWDANTEPEVIGYKIHRGEASGVYTVTVDVGNVTEYPLVGLDDTKTYYYAVTAYSATQESGFSNEVIRGPPVVGIAAATDLQVNWQEIKPMAIDITLSYTTAAWANHNNITINAPTSLADGDFLLAAINLLANVTITPPSGWASLVRVNNANGTFVEVFYKRASSEGASWTWNHSNTNSAGFVKRFTGVVATGAPEDCTRDTQTVMDWADSITNSAITTATAGAALCQILAGQDTTGWSGETLTERIDVGRIALCCDLQASAGSSGNKSATASTGDSLVGILIALKPAAGGGASTENVSGEMGRPAGALVKTINVNRSISGEL